MTRDRRAARLRGLYAVTPSRDDTRALVEMVAASIDGGAALVQYRAKGRGFDAALAQARSLLALCRSRGVPLIINDSIELARACGADGIHLGRDDATPQQARAELPDAIIGVSCYDDPGQASAAAANGADYVAIGSVFASSTKPSAVRASLDLIARARDAGGLPVAAIGGVTASNAPAAIDAGADMIAVIGALFDRDDIVAAAREMARLFDETNGGSDDVREQPRAV
jgi:thiamine-phosphate pyrophosphorylase